MIFSENRLHPIRSTPEGHAFADDAQSTFLALIPAKAGHPAKAVMQDWAPPSRRQAFRKRIAYGFGARKPVSTKSINCSWVALGLS